MWGDLPEYNLDYKHSDQVAGFGFHDDGGFLYHEMDVHAGYRCVDGMIVDIGVSNGKGDPTNFDGLLTDWHPDDMCTSKVIDPITSVPAVPHGYFM